MEKVWVVLVLACLLFMNADSFSQVSATSTAIIVPDNYPSITEAIANAEDGDVIYVRNGVYNEEVLEINKEVSIRGEDLTNTIVNLNPPLLTFSDVMGHTKNYPSVAIKITADNVKISGFTINSNGGIYGSGDGTEIVSNIITAESSNFPITSTNYVSALLTCNLTGSNVTFARNTLNGEDWRFFGSNFNLVENMIDAPNGGVECNGDNCNVSGNNIAGSLRVRGSENTIKTNAFEILFLIHGDSNIIQGNLGEISIGNSDRSCSNNIVSGNLVKGPSAWGIWVGMYCKNNLVFDNYIVDEGYSQFGGEYSGGISMCYEFGKMGTNNTFYHNVFINNSLNVKFYENIILGGNFWDNGILGNYWSDYKGTDTNSDGIGDTPYTINSENSDNYPLITPFAELTINIPPPVYDSPIDIATAISQQPTPKPTAPSTISPTKSVATSNPTANPNATNTPAYFVAVPEFPVPIVLLLLVIVPLVAAIVLKKRGTPQASI